MVDQQGKAGLIGTVTLLISSFGSQARAATAEGRRYGCCRSRSFVTRSSRFPAVRDEFRAAFLLRAWHGFGFGGEWAAGAVLIGATVHDKYRGRGVGLVLAGWHSPLEPGADSHKAHLLSVPRPPYLWAAIKGCR